VTHMTVINAKNLILGRLASSVAKRALLGESIELVNCEQAVITGNKKWLIARYRQRRERGTPTQGPFFPRQPERFVKRTIRGMLPYKKELGRAALGRVTCHVGIPPFLEGKQLETIQEAGIERLSTTKIVSVKVICHSMGASQ